VNYDDDTLMAYADGELDEAQRVEIAAAVARDPALAQRIEQHRTLRAGVASAFADVLKQPVPEHLLAAARGKPAAADNKSGKVLQFPARAARPPAAPWRGREWAAIAATLVLGVLLSWRFLAPGGDIATRGGALVARGDLAAALNSQLASNQPEDARVIIGLTFKSHDGDYCRSFVMRASATAGLACHVDGEWRIPVTNSVELTGGDLRQAAASLPASVLAAIETRRVGDALDATDELAARDANWQ